MNSLQHAIGRISTWGKVSGVLNIIIGGIGAFFGLFMYVVGAIPGAIQIVLGVFLYQIGKQAGNLKVNMEDEQSQLSLFDYLGKYLLWYGIWLIVGIVLGILLFILSFAAFVALIEMGL